MYKQRYDNSEKREYTIYIQIFTTDNLPFSTVTGEKVIFLIVDIWI